MVQDRLAASACYEAQKGELPRKGEIPRTQWAAAVLTAAAAAARHVLGHCGPLTLASSFRMLGLIVSAARAGQCVFRWQPKRTGPQQHAHNHTEKLRGQSISIEILTAHSHCPPGHPGLSLGSKADGGAGGGGQHVGWSEGE
jgi:hypothetical protein